MVSKVLVATLFSATVAAGCMPSLPENTKLDHVTWLGQNWSGKERHWFHHATQGTSTLPVPYEWFMALEQPRLWLTGEAPLFSDQAFLQRFGFIPSTAAVSTSDGGTIRSYGSAAAYDEAYFPGNADALPVGFARTPGYVDPTTGKKLQDQIGFTCAACHTGHLEYNGVGLRIDGAPAMTDLGKFRKTIGLAIAYTDFIPGRFDRFARRVLGEEYNAETKKTLADAFEKKLEQLKLVKDLTDPFEPKNVEEGFGRLDALNRIGNLVFFADLLGSEVDAIENYAPTDAPVNFPHIWDTSWFDWVQYDASIMQPMVRNAGEALGVSARINLINPDRTLFDSSVQVGEIDAMERLLAGDDPLADEPGFKGLRAPIWPEEVLGKIDVEKKEKGRALYQELCVKCHLPPVDDPDGRFWDDKYWWTPKGAKGRYLRVRRLPLKVIGTDPGQAEVLGERKMKVPGFLDIVPNQNCKTSDEGTICEVVFGEALAAVAEKTANVWYDQHEISPEQRERMSGNRPNLLNDLEKPGYKARPLDGIWATAPFLHNGSVPNLWALLSPIDEGERPEKFCLGSRAFDPVKVGFSTDCGKGLFELDTSIDGNRNTGHEFDDGTKGKGVIGRRLEPDERWALIEFLKSTPSY